MSVTALQCKYDFFKRLDAVSRKFERLLPIVFGTDDGKMMDGANLLKSAGVFGPF